MLNSRKAAFSPKKILLPIDFSPSSDAALEAATGLAEQFHADVHLVHVIPEIPDFNGSDFFPETQVLQERKAAIEEKLNACKKQLILDGVTSSFSIEEGNDIVGALMRVIKQQGTDLLVLSTHGMSGWHPLIFGSIAQEMANQVSCTLLLLQSGEVRPVVVNPARDLSHSFFVQSNSSEFPGEPLSPGSSQPRLDRIAEDMAKRGGRTEHHYDEAHSIFSK